LEEALRDLGEQQIKALVLDLRNNPGGLLEQAISVSKVLISKAAN
jgi:carboxyl-terminal processing protease